MHPFNDSSTQMAENDERPVSVYDNLNTILPSPHAYTIKTPNAAMSNPNTSIQSSINASSPPIHYPSNTNSNNNNVDELNESTSNQARPLSNGYNGIAAVKAALNDAKSKFFGLNQSNGKENSDTNRETLLPYNTSQSYQTPKIVQKPQPKYQNIPENSALFRSASESPQLQLPQYDSDPNTPETSRFNADHSTNSSPTSSKSQATRAKESPSLVQHTLVSLKPPAGDMDFGMSIQPSQAVYMATTVPQNIKGSKIAGRHTPTRNSLRHSRMLVVNKSYQGSTHPNPMGFRFPTLTRLILVLKIIVGALITALGVWIFLLAPHMDIQDNPYWSGLVLLSAGFLGYILIHYRRVKRHNMRENCFNFLKWDSCILSILASLLCLIASLCALIHISRLSDAKCISSDILLEHAACQCTYDFDNSSASNSTFTELDAAPKPSHSFDYRDLSCSEVNGVWTFILTLSIALNAIGSVLSSVYLLLLFFCRYREVYTSVQTSAF